MNARVDSHIPVEIKEKASKELVAHGLSISGFIRMTLSSVSNDGLPKYWGIPNAETMASINEAIDDLIMPSRKSRDFSHEMDRFTQRPFGHFFFWSALYF